MTLSTTHRPATDLGYLLHKHPDKALRFDVAAGAAHVVWPEATPERSTVALLLEVDPVALVRGPAQASLSQYVNDRPYVASSLLAVALGKVFRTALNGRCDARPDLAERPLPLEIRLPAVPSQGGPELLERLFAPLGWSVRATPIPLDPRVPDWGASRYVALELTGEVRLADALTQLYVLLPVLDDTKHYWVSQEEVDKLLRAGGRWLATHPERDLITRRYLRHRRELVLSAVGRLAEIDDTEPETLDNAVAAGARPLARRRVDAVVAALAAEGASSVVDLGCGEGALLRALLNDPRFARVLGVDVSARALETAARRLNFDRMSDHVRARIELIQSSLTYRDDRLRDYDAVVLMEVIEHLDPPRLPALARTLFGAARPRTVLVTTPNAEYNVRYAGLRPGAFRHPDHRFEWTRSEFAQWAAAVAHEHGYSVHHAPVGDDDPEIGPPTQLAIFRREEVR
ncbi:3' terminal RNA ribose 2'-O-methyltransferase Hen1 [Cryptosporangium arvum]|uniref:3' terminal RNA ribose 2'-O-methyltransferase Hen1 n=1 Tax=Cryptosporangium arvum TaxID=80871 RepID=UPI001FDF2B64|nr:3' terminal RNA ribose 2'-O-methyltransferase Hen1 [Cryptosporangium arvum]